MILVPATSLDGWREWLPSADGEWQPGSSAHELAGVIMHSFARTFLSFGDFQHFVSRWAESFALMESRTEPGRTLQNRTPPNRTPQNLAEPRRTE
jgi:hypothetical protein